MKTNWINECHVEGYVFSHSLKERICGKNSRTPGQEFISGSIDVATDESATNVVRVAFSFVTPTYKRSGKPNATYEALKTIMNGPTLETAGPSNALKVRVDGDIECNSFVSSRTNEMVKEQRMRGSFVHIENNVIFKDFATFKAEMLICNFVCKEQADTGEDVGTLSGYVFDFKGDLVPVIFDIHNKNGIDYYEKQEISNANRMFDTIQGKIISTTIKKEKEKDLDGGAWGEPVVDFTSVPLRSWEVVSSSGVVAMDDCEYLTEEDLKNLVNRHEDNLAFIRKRFNERNKTKEPTAKAATTAEVAANEAMMVF